MTYAINKLVRAIRGKATQREFADRLGVTTDAVRNYEKGRRTPEGLPLLLLLEWAPGDLRRDVMELLPANLRNTRLFAFYALSVSDQESVELQAVRKKKSIAEYCAGLITSGLRTRVQEMHDDLVRSSDQSAAEFKEKGRSQLARARESDAIFQKKSRKSSASHRKSDQTKTA